MGIETLVVTAGIGVLLLVALAVAVTRERTAREKFKSVQDDLAAARAQLAEVEERSRIALADKVAAETRLAEATSNITTLRQERDSAFTERNKARLDLQETEKQVALARQEVAATERRMSDWEKARSEHLQNSKAAVLEVASTLSSKLIADHKQETDAAKKEAEEKLRNTTKELYEQFQTVVQNVASLNDQVTRNRDITDTVLRALSSPGGASHFAEIGLENSLKSFGLERGRDFLIQYTVSDNEEGERLRPDAIVFLPFDSVLVIDSKTSKYLLELAKAEGTDDEEKAYANLARTMNAHLKSLTNKDYRAAVLAAYRNAGRQTEIRRILNVMCLPNDAALEKLSRADPEFPKKAAKEEIIVAGPTGLAGIIGFARVEIDLGRQAENQKHIVEVVQALLESVSVVLSHMASVGKGIKLTAESFTKLTASINTRLLPRTRRLEQLGVRPARSKALPTGIPGYQLISMEGPTTIDGESEDLSTQALTDQTGPARVIETDD